MKKLVWDIILENINVFFFQRKRRIINMLKTNMSVPLLKMIAIMAW